MAGKDPVRAAGVVLWRPADAGIEIGLVHRPRYDDWSHPKGRLDEGEHPLVGAARETLEETGHRIALGRSLGTVGYQVSTPDGRRTAKTVDYFSGEVRAGGFSVNEEVDELRWVSPAEAVGLLSYPFDRTVLAGFERLGPGLVTVVLVRHAKAGRRDEWGSDDDLRPLNAAGWGQAERLRRVLPLFGPARVHSAPRVRCAQTVAGIADDLGVRITEEPLLAEEGYWPDPARGTRRLRELVFEGATAVVSSQGGVIPDVIERLADGQTPVPGRIRSRKGSLWVLSFDPGTRTMVSADYHEVV